MSNRYIITFNKTGYIKYTSHLDMVRLFERVFKRGDIRLAYSQGFNPHPKLVFAQPLSLGYTSESEQLEIETRIHYEVADLMRTMNSLMPEGIKVLEIQEMPEYQLNDSKATIASKVQAALFTIDIPAAGFYGDLGDICTRFMAQDEIIALKKQKKRKHEMKEVNIRPMILELEGFEKMEKNQETGLVDNKIILKTKLAQGSTANLSPELLIPRFIEFAGLSVERSEIEVTRNKLIYE